MDREQKFKKWLVEWQPKHTTVNFNKNVWREETLTAYTDVLKKVVTDLKITDIKIKKNLFDYHLPKVYFNVYKMIINHDNFKSLEYFPMAKKSLKRYLDFLYESN